MDNQEIVQQWGGIKQKVVELCNWKTKMTDPNGTLEHLWSAISKKASWAVMVTVIVIMFGLMGTLFTLLYGSNKEILSEFGEMKTDIAVIKTQLEKE